MSNKIESLSFRCPVHQSPAAIAHTFGYEPYISLKIDGIFKEVSSDDYDKYYPIFPPTWKKIQGELYQRDINPPILYIFYIEVDKPFASLLDMYNEIEQYFQKTGEFKMLSHRDILTDMVENIGQSFEWLGLKTAKPNGLIWFPKKYWKLDTSLWNTYIQQLSDLFDFIEDNDFKQFIAHDGLVISPNIPSNKKSLVKLKPRSELTIDLFYTGRGFFSKERTSYAAIIGSYNWHELKPKSVYRLAPIVDKTGKYIPVFMREPGKKPNPDNIIMDILFKFENYFDIKDLLNIYNRPWYSELNEQGLTIMNPLFQYTQHIYNQVLQHMNRGHVLDIGCGAMGQYHRHFLNQHLISYNGLDVDLDKLHQSQVKVSYNEKFKFILTDICYSWDVDAQAQIYPNIWHKYFAKMINPNKTYTNIISIFSSQYANKSKENWSTYVGEINKRSNIGTRFFAMWIDHTKISDVSKSEFYNMDKKTNILNVNLPHKEPHSEPCLGSEIIESFINTTNNTNHWQVDNSIGPIDTLPIDSSNPISEYIKLINWIVLVKVD